MKILDIGSGTNPFLQHNCEVVHVDINRNLPHLDVVCDIHILPFRSGSFDICITSHILEHITDLMKAFEEMKRVSKDFIIKVPNGSFYKASTKSREHIFSWNEYTLANLLKKANFSHVKVKSQRQLPKFKGKLSKLRTLKFLISSLFLGNNELLAICHNEV